MTVLSRVKDDLGHHCDLFAQDDHAAVFKCRCRPLFGADPPGPCGSLEHIRDKIDQFARLVPLSL